MCYVQRYLRDPVSLKSCFRVWSAFGGSTWISTMRSPPSIRLSTAHWRAALLVAEQSIPMPTVRAFTIFSLAFLLFLCVCCVCEVSNSKVVVIFDLDELWEYFWLLKLECYLCIVVLAQNSREHEVSRMHQIMYSFFFFNIIFFGNWACILNLQVCTQFRHYKSLIQLDMKKL